MGTFVWILASTMLMSAIALVGGVSLLLPEHVVRRITLPLVAFAAGSLLGGALFHLMPASVAAGASPSAAFLWLGAGFALFFALEQFLHWHHCHDGHDCKRPFSYLVLVADALHNFLDGVAIGGAFLLDTRVGIATWLAVAAHEVPQEIGDFAVLLRAGWERSRVLLYNWLSALTVVVGGMVAYAASLRSDVRFLLPLAAGSFVYIAASDLIPEVTRHAGARRGMEHFLAFLAGGVVMLAVRAAVD